MTLDYILDRIRADVKIKQFGERLPRVESITSDSRDVTSGALFIAISGNSQKGLSFVDDAIQKGASVIVAEEAPQKEHEGVTWLQVDNARKATAHIARAFYRDPSSEITLVGVTGTNGKTTTASLLYELFSLCGYKSGLISTVCIKKGLEESPSKMTTPDAITLNRYLREMADEGCTYIFMEVSSHALDQDRVLGLTFTAGVFTNLTHDHLDYHKTFDAYLKAKKRFFDMLPPQSWSVVNIDDKNGLVMVQNTKSQVITYALHTLADYHVKLLEQHLDGTLFELNGIEMNSRLCGIFNLYNILAVCAVAHKLLPDLSLEELCIKMSMLHHVNGRFDVFRSPDQGFFVVVDYAHTPDALKNVLQTITDLPHKKVITIVGCGGDRDSSKRSIMADVATTMSDKVILTSDNPRSERPEDIIAQMKENLSLEQLARTTDIVDRRKAIEMGCFLASEGDVVLVAGKGHETYQEIQGVRYHLDDKEIVRELLKI